MLVYRRWSAARFIQVWHGLVAYIPQQQLLPVTQYVDLLNIGNQSFATNDLQQYLDYGLQISRRCVAYLKLFGSAVFVKELLKVLMLSGEEYFFTISI